MTRDVRELARPVADRQDDLLPLHHALHGNDGMHAACLTLGVDALYVVALVTRDSFGLEAASSNGVEQGRDEQRFVVACAPGLPRERKPVRVQTARSILNP
jgi:hypothetical protein